MKKKNIEFAPDALVMAHREILNVLFSEIIGLDLNECIVTDESYLTDFCDREDYEAINRRFGIMLNTTRLYKLYEVGQMIQQKWG